MLILSMSGNCLVTKCETGINIDGYDANAVIVHCNVTSNRRWGIWDQSFLGNCIVGCHAQGNGFDAANGRYSQALYGGQAYAAHPDATEAELVVTQPGTDTNKWRACVNGGTVAWTGSNPEGTFRAGGSYRSSGNTQAPTFLGCYSEGGQGLVWLGQHTLWVGGIFAETPIQGGGVIKGLFNEVQANAVVTSNTPVGGGSNIQARLGGMPESGRNASLIYDPAGSRFPARGSFARSLTTGGTSATGRARHSSP